MFGDVPCVFLGFPRKSVNLQGRIKTFCYETIDL